MQALHSPSHSDKVWPSGLCSPHSGSYTPLSIFVTLSPSLSYEPDAGRSLGVGIAMALWASQSLRTAGMFAGWQGGMDPVQA